MYLEGTPEIDGDLVIDNPSHWIIKNTGLERGARLPGLLGYVFYQASSGALV